MRANPFLVCLNLSTAASSFLPLPGHRRVVYAAGRFLTFHGARRFSLRWQWSRLGNLPAKFISWFILI
ncbi:hypothetical protein DAI22_03g266250 [Oryza sativa Japonica Group]|nr:hypothetical protein DAI22_03g266250 [Oryza sativa Japonica Group]